MSTPYSWPASLPVFSRDPYSVSPRPGAIQVDSGIDSARALVYTEVNEVVQVEVLLSGTQEIAFWNFFENTLAMGTQSFVVPILIGGSLTNREAIFIGAPPSIVPANKYGYVRASFSLLTWPGQVDLLSQLIGLSWRLPCLTSLSPTGCSCAPTVSNSLVLDLPAGTYDVTFRVRGVVELGTYSGGTALSPTYFYKNKTAISPSVANIYRLAISSPAASYYINNGTNASSLTALDYEITIPIDAGATITLDANSVDNSEYKNNGSAVVADDDVSRPVVVSQPYNGQFAQIDGLSVVKV